MVDLEKNYDLIVENRYMGFLKELGFNMLKLREGYAKAEIEVGYKHANPIGSVHGGVLFTIADSVGGAAATSRGRFVTTMDASINYLRAGIGCKKIIAESREIKVGKTTCVYDVVVTDENGTELCLARLSYFYLGEVTEEYLKSNIEKHKQMELENKINLD